MSTRKNIAIPPGLICKQNQTALRLAYGTLTLVAGTANQPVPEGFTQEAIVVAMHLVVGGVQGILNGECDGVTITITSSNAGDTSDVQWICVE